MKISDAHGSGASGQADKAMPQGAKVMMAILKDMNIMEYEPRVVEQLLEFSYRYISTILEDSKVLSHHARKKAVDIDDVKLAVQMYTEHNLTNPPTRDILLEVASRKNATPLPIPKASGGMRLPPDRHCLTACNYKLKPHKKRGGGKAGGSQAGTSKGGGGSSFSSSTGFTMKTLSGGKTTPTTPAANIRINPVTSGNNTPRIQIQTQATATGSGGQPMFSMTVNPVALGGAGTPSAAGSAKLTTTTGIKRTADQMERS